MTESRSISCPSAILIPRGVGVGRQGVGEGVQGGCDQSGTVSVISFSSEVEFDRVCWPPAQARAQSSN